MTEESLSHAIEDTERYAGLLTQMSELTDDLIDAAQAIQDEPGGRDSCRAATRNMARQESCPPLSSWIKRIDSLLTSREALCGQIASAHSALTGAINALGEGRESLAVSMDRIKGLGDSLLDRQAECENLLAERLSACRAELRTLGRHRGLKTAYREPNPVHSSRFLDSRR